MAIKPDRFMPKHTCGQDFRLCGRTLPYCHHQRVEEQASRCLDGAENSHLTVYLVAFRLIPRLEVSWLGSLATAVGRRRSRQTRVRKRLAKQVTGFRNQIDSEWLGIV